MCKYYQRIEHNYDQEAIHHFRVEYKKLRAFLRLLSAAGEHGKIKIPSSLNHVYQKAGAVRDLQLHIETIKGNTSSSHSPVNYIRRVRRKLAAAKKELAKTMQHDVLPQSQKKIEKKIKETLKDATIENFVSEKMSEIACLLRHKIIRDTDLHSVRKSLKDIIYIALMFKKDLSLPFPVNGWDAEREKYLTGIATELGCFQDSCISLAHLKNDQRSAAEPGDSNVIADIYRAQSRLKRQQKRLLIRDALTLITVTSDRHH